ncbi:MAG: hemerythrin domain-containing protein [Alphaproteobacteria bacterium]|nr:hemerythrin domain-containing protein [Alphaproteobacteria bacterium]
MQAAQSADDLLKADHRTVEALFAQYEKASSSDEKSKLAKQICKALIVHTLLEEQIFYPACREKGVEEDIMDEAQVEHDGAKMLISDLIAGSPDDEFYDAKMKVLSEYIKHHVGEEEKPRTGIFAKANSGGVDMKELGKRLQERKQEFESRIDENNLEPPKPKSLTSQMRQEDFRMPRGSNYRERDDQGRFMSDDDDDNRGSRSSRGGGNDRDERGRFMSDDDDDRRGSRGGGGGRGQGGWFGDSEGHSQAARSRGGSSRGRRYEDDDDDGRGSRGGRGQGGWFGDSEGHSEASRRGWERSDHEGSGWYGDSRGHSQASRRGWERSDHEGSGWYGDPEGHSEASERGWEGRSSSSRGGSRSRRDDDDDDRRGSRGGRGGGGGGGGGRGQGGWFGDSEGHSEAAERGWESRSSSRGGSSSRGRRDDDDDDRRGSRGGGGRGQGGWFGDSRGHSEASRRGWENR